MDDWRSIMAEASRSATTTMFSIDPSHRACHSLSRSTGRQDSNVVMSSFTCYTVKTLLRGKLINYNVKIIHKP